MLLVCEAVEAGSSVDKDCRDVATFAIFLERHGYVLLFRQFSQPPNFCLRITKALRECTVHRSAYRIRISIGVIEIVSKGLLIYQVRKSNRQGECDDENLQDKVGGQGCGLSVVVV